MADNTQVIGATLQVDASSAVTASKSISDMKANIKDLKQAFDDTKDGSDEQTAAFKKLKDAQDQLAKSTSDLNARVEEGSGHFKNLKEGVISMGGPLGAAGEGVGKLSTAFKALLANPVVLVIVAIVAALTLLYKAFTNTFEGGEKVEQMFAGVKAAAQALFDNLGKIGDAIVKFFHFDFSGALKDIKEVGNAAANAYNQMAGLTKQAQELAREQATNDVEQAKRQAALADLRAKAYDDSVPLAKRKEALKDLQAQSESAAKVDLDLAKRVTDNKIAQLTLQKEGAQKNFIEIAKLQADEIKNATEHANELKAIGRSLSQAEKQEKEEAKAAAAKAAEEEKKTREQNQAFQSQLSKLQHENALAGITDQYAKEKQALENKLADEAATIQKDFENKKLTRDQYQQLETAQAQSAQIQRAGLEDKHKKDVADKEAKFQKDLAEIVGKTAADGLTNQRAMELAQLEITHQEKLAQAIKDYQTDAVKLAAIRSALDAQLRAERQKLEDKYQKDDAQKKLKLEDEQQKAIIGNQKLRESERLAAVDADQKLYKQAFDNKIITELEYNTKVDDLAKARTTIREQERKNNQEIATDIGNALSSLSDLVGKQTAAGKAFAVASASIAAIESAVKSYNSLADIPIIGPALGAIAAAAAIASGIANVNKIIAVQVPGQGSGGGTAPSITAPAATAAPIAPTQQSTMLNQNSIDGIGSAMSGRTYVLSSDVKNDADRNARLTRAAQLGG